MKPNILKINDLMLKLAKDTGLTFDGREETRLFSETIFTNSKDMNKKEYNAMESDINKYIFKGNGFEVYAWNDCGGYNYWNVKQEEDNYIQVTAAILNPTKVKAKELAKAVKNAHSYFCKYSRY